MGLITYLHRDIRLLIHEIVSRNNMVDDIKQMHNDVWRCALDDGSVVIPLKMDLQVVYHRSSLEVGDRHYRRFNMITMGSKRLGGFWHRTNWRDNKFPSAICSWTRHYTSAHEIPKNY